MNFIFWITIKIWFNHLDSYQDSHSYSFGYYIAASFRTYSSLPRAIWFTRSKGQIKTDTFLFDLSAAKGIRTQVNESIWVLSLLSYDNLSPNVFLEHWTVKHCSQTGNWNSEQSNTAFLTFSTALIFENKL